jgi:YidC/Oxa1 family membrane protein insertase
MDEQNRNLLLATVLSFLVILTWFILFPPETPVTTDPVTEAVEATTPAVDGDGTVLAADPAPEAPRVSIETPRLSGSLSLQGGRIDDLSLLGYNVELDGEEKVRLLTPLGQDFAYYAVYGWAASDGVAADAVPGPDTLWSVEAGEVLTPDTPVTLIWDNGAGLIFRRTYTIDQNYMFGVSQSVENTTAAAVTLAPYGFIARHGTPNGAPFFIRHEGVIRMSDGELQEITYANMEDLEADPRGGLSEPISVTENGWVGFTDVYWMTTMVPSPGRPFTSTARFMPATNIFQTETVYAAETVAPGQTLTVDTQLFAGAKEWETIRAYQNEGGIAGFLDSIDWGWFFFLTKPMFWLLHHLNALIGNMGWSIIALTLVIKALVLPLAYKSYVSMAKMKELQPEMEKLKEKAGDDRQALQQGMMKLYKDNKVNPAAGCLPILVQIPIFFSLYKVIFVTIELRHAPWFGWIRDLSAPDPSSLINLFGLLPWEAPAAGSLLALIFLGILPIILGISMWLQQKLNPQPTDPVQKTVFAWMPWVFMFMLGSFASGLIIYWIANNIITFAQQYLIMRSHGHKPDVFGNIISSLRRKPVEAAAAPANSDKKPKGK